MNKPPRRRSSLKSTAPALLGVSAFLAAASMPMLRPSAVLAQTSAPVPGDLHKSIVQRLRGLRKLPDNERARVTRQLALDIRQLPTPAERLGLASGLAGLATEGDFGHDTLQEVADTLAEALRAQPTSAAPTSLDDAYLTLAQLAHYENVKVTTDSPQYVAAMSRLEADDRRRAEADFTLTDLQGRSWTLKALRGKVVLVNFWATWCPPCRKEIPDLETLYNRFKGRGFVILGISDETDDKVRPYVGQHAMTYPVLLDPGRKVNNEFVIQSIPRSLIYDRNGKLAAEAIDMRTQKQLLALLARAGLR